MNFTLASSSDCHYRPFIPPSLGNATERELSAYRIPVIVPDNNKKNYQKNATTLSTRGRGYSATLCHHKPVTLNYPESTATRGEKRPRKNGKGRQLRRFHFTRRARLTSSLLSPDRDFSIASPPLLLTQGVVSPSPVPSEGVSQFAYQFAVFGRNGGFGVDSLKCSIPAGGSVGAEPNCQNDLRRAEH